MAEITSWEGYEQYFNELIAVAECYKKCSDLNKSDPDNMYFDNVLTSTRCIKTQSRTYNIIGESLLRIKELQNLLVHEFGFNWMFVYNEWSSITNSN